MTASQTVSYRVDGETVAQFEIDASHGFTAAASAGEIITDVRNAVGPAIEAARAVLDRVKPLGSECVEVKFGVKVSGSESWSVARSASDATYEITLSWRPKD
jgi:hypothetical protein